MMRVERTEKQIGILGGMLVSFLLLGLPAEPSAEQIVPSGKPVLDPAIDFYVPSATASGAIVVAGSDTMYPIMLKLASVFRQLQPDVKMAVQGGGSDAALRGFIQDQAYIRRGDADPNPRGHQVSGSIALLASSRPLTTEEQKDFKSRYGYEPTEIPIAMDAIAIYVNAQNPVHGLTLEQVDAIFGRDRKRGFQEDITIWGQVGVKNGWEEQPINLYGRDKQSGTRTFFIHEVLLSGELKATVRETRGAALEILAISRDPLGIAYAGVGIEPSTVRVVPLAEKAGMSYVAPSAESASNGTYPLGRYLYLYFRKAPGTMPDPAIVEFLKFVNSRQGQEVVVKAGAYCLSAAQVTANLQQLTGASITEPALTGRAK